MKDKLKVEELHISIPFYEWIDGEIELAEEIYNNYLSNVSNIEKIKKFIILDYFSSLYDNGYESKEINKKENQSTNTSDVIEEIKDEDFPF